MDELLERRNAGALLDHDEHTPFLAIFAFSQRSVMMTYTKLFIVLLLWVLPGTSLAQSSLDQPSIRFGILTPG